MRNIIALVLGAALAAGAPASPRAAAGKVVVLDNENTMTGDIERDGDAYRVRRLTGEVSIPAARVLAMCGSMEEAYAFLKCRANLGDPDERLRLSDWCRQHHLHAQALAEMEAAAKLRPEDARLRRIADTMRRGLAKPVLPPRPIRADSRLPRVDVDSATLAVFATKVQPMLMNACAGCHTGKRGGSFDLIRTHGGGLADRRSLDHNLAAVASHLDPRDPGRSRLIAKAITLHAEGMTVPPLHGKHQMEAARMLERWVRQAVANNPGLQAPPAPVAPPAAMAVVPAKPTVFGEGRPVAPPMEKPMEASKPGSEEPGSPDDFNKENHGDKPGG
ncbi:MAG: hypothetical protein K2W96_14635 [Gemmataceae bacterium]|nr:hypothetical protein [Gemmataceae bacterium]